MPDNLIEFHCPAGRSFPRPFPAGQDIPAWFKQMPTEVPAGPGGQTWLTLKRCPPFLDALAGGYLIPLAADVQFTMGPNGLACKSEIPLIHTHPREQLGDAFEGRIVVKFVNPWIIKTPPGYSCLFVQPLNRFEVPFQIFSGIVETDSYYMEIHFPAICLMPPGSSLILKQGTPIAQVFPFRRGPWNAEFETIDSTKWKQAVEEFKGTAGHYKERYWQRKEYK